MNRNKIIYKENYTTQVNLEFINQKAIYYTVLLYNKIMCSKRSLNVIKELRKYKEVQTNRPKVFEGHTSIFWFQQPKLSPKVDELIFC